MDWLRIVRMRVDRGRLVAMPFGGTASRLLELEPYRQAIEASQDWFDRRAR